MISYLIGELLGTMTLIIFGAGVVANVVLTHSKGHSAGWLTITTGWFVGVTMGIFVAQSTGSPNADINPAVSLAKYFLDIYPMHGLLLIIMAQIIGAFLGAIVVWLAYLPHFAITEDKNSKLAVFSTIPAIRHYPSNIICEIIGTIVLIIGVGAIFGNPTGLMPAPELGPYLVGFLVWGIGLSLGGPTGYAINPARDLGPRLAHAILPIAGKGSSDWRYAWVPVLGPILGSLIGVLIWKILF